MMPFYKLLVPICFTICPVIAGAQNCKDDFLGTKTLYHYTRQNYTPIPKGYQAIFINHVGRHGARHLTKEVNTSFAYDLLAAAEGTAGLSSTGQKLQQMVKALAKVEKGNVKSISMEGIEELQGIGQRMYRAYPGIFIGGQTIPVGFTKEIRTKQSAEAFLSGIKKVAKDSLRVKEYNDDTNLRFYDIAPAYKTFEANGAWQAALSKLQRSVHITQVNSDFTARIFTADFLNNIKATDRDKFTSDIFGFMTIAYSLATEIKQAGFQLADLDFKPFFTCNEILALSKIDVADDYLKKAPGLNNNGIQVRIAVPLLINFMTTADDFIKSGGPSVQLRFAHAETIAPFAALLNIASASKVSTDITQLSKSWQSGQVIPLSANIQWIFYKKKNGSDYLVKVLLNEKEARIAGIRNNSPYYKWQTLRAFYINKLAGFHVKPGDDMINYLANVKE